MCVREIVRENDKEFILEAVGNRNGDLNSYIQIDSDTSRNKLSWDLKDFPRWDFPSSSDGKVSSCNAGDPGSLIPGSEYPLEKEMAPHSYTVAWKIPWMEERGTLQSVGSQRVGRD